MATRSLGTLTLDLIAKTGSYTAGLDKAGRKSKSTFKTIEKDVNTASKVMAGFVASSVAGMAGLTVSVADNAKEIQNLSRVANANTQEFQRGAFALSKYNIEQDKYADILKDVNDKVGDFLQTGGGPLADFFENIAPQIGVTAEEFARLSGPQALQKYVDSLESANLSQSEMTFYMEAIASDATLLLPLLKNNGEEFKRLGDQAERTGNVLSDMDFQELQQLTNNVDSLKAAWTGMGNEVAFAAIPAVNELVGLLSAPETIRNAQLMGNAIVVSVKGAAETINGAVNVARFLGEELARFNGRAADDIAGIEERIATLNKQIKDTQSNALAFGVAPNQYVEQERIKLLQKLQDELKKEEQLRDEYHRNEQQRHEQRKAAVSEIAAESTEKFAKISNAREKEIEDLVNDIAEMEGRAAAMFANIHAGKDSQYREDLAERFNAIQFSMLPDLDKLESYYDSQLDIVNAALAAELTTKQEAAELEKQIIAEKNSAIAQLEATRMAQMSSFFGEQHQLLSQGLGESNALAKAAFAAQKLFAIPQMKVATELAAVEAMAIIPGPAGIAFGNIVKGLGYAGIGSVIGTTIAGMAHDGIDYIPEDGTWNLKKGERVSTAETSAKMDATLERVNRGLRENKNAGWNINIVNNAQADVSIKSFDHRRQVIDIVVDQLGNSSSRGRQALQATSNVTAKGNR